MTGRFQALRILLLGLGAAVGPVGGLVLCASTLRRRHALSRGPGAPA